MLRNLVVICLLFGLTNGQGFDEIIRADSVEEMRSLSLSLGPNQVPLSGGEVKISDAEFLTMSKDQRACCAVDVSGLFIKFSIL